jgi:hypothetical protein
MTAPVKLAAFFAALLAVFGVAYLTGTQSAALLAPVPTHKDAQEFGGLSSVSQGYTLQLPDATGEPGDDQFMELTITGPDGRPVPEYIEIDGAPMHVIAIRRDLTGYQHIYPEQGEGASWWAALNLTPGPWRLIAEFRPAALDRRVVLGADLTISGDYRPQPVTAAGDRDQVDGFVATLSRPITTATNSRPVITLTKDGRPVTDLRELHGSLGHAVIIRPGDLGYLHLHAAPVAETYRGPDLAFSNGVREPGTYRIFVEFTRGSDSHVAAFTSAVTE